MNSSHRLFLVAVVLLMLLSLVALVLAQSSAGFDLSWHVLAGGGGEATSAGYRVSGTAGQALAGPPLSSSAAYGVSSGFWQGGGAARTMLPVVFRAG